MADPFNLAASIIAVIQISGKVISLANSLGSVHVAPRNLRVICNEVSIIKSLFKTFSADDPTKFPPHTQALAGNNCPIEGCGRFIFELGVSKLSTCRIEQPSIRLLDGY
jgi:hypothetical protein